MGKRSKSKKSKQAIVNTPQQTPVIVEQNKPKKWWLFAGKAERAIVFIGAVVALVLGISDLLDLGKTPLEKYEEVTVDTGVLKTPPIISYKRPENSPNFSTGALLDNYPPIKGILIPDIDNSGIALGLGDNIEFVTAKQLYEGLYTSPEYFAECADTKIIFGLKDNRLYVSTEFKDLQKEETIGIIEFNHWKIYRENRLSFKNTDQKLEVKDKQNNIVFSINFLGKSENNNVPLVFIKGYFINPKSIFIIKSQVSKKNPLVTTFCFSKNENNWKQKALIEINDIKTIF